MKLKDTLRTLLRIRTPRTLLPPSQMPVVGSNIVRGRLRIRLKYPVSDEQWAWFTSHGWRTIDMRLERRRYICVSDNVLIKLLKADNVKRDELHATLVRVLDEVTSVNSNTMRKAESTTSHQMQ